MNQIRTGRHPHEIALSVGACIIGSVSVLLPASANPAIYSVLGACIGRAFFAGLAFFSLVILLGVAKGKIEGLLIERAGLLVVCIFFGAYAIAIISHRGFPIGLAGAALPALLAVANVWRAVQIRNDLRLLRDHLRSSPIGGGETRETTTQ